MAKKKRLRFRFGLMTLLSAVTVFCVWLGYQAEQTRCQREAVESLSRSNAIHVVYDYEADPDSGENDKPGVPQWLLNIFGKDFFYDVEFVSANYFFHPADEARLARLSDLPKLKRFELVASSLSNRGLESIASATSLEELVFVQVEFADEPGLSTLSHLENLQTLTVFKCDGITLAELAQFDSSPIQELSLHWFADEPGALASGIQGFGSLQRLSLNSISLGHADFAALAKLPSLTRLELDNFSCSEEALRILNESPSLETIHVRTNVSNQTAGEARAKQQRLRELLPDKNVTFY